MEQKSHSLFPDVLGHLVEHLVTAHLVLYQRISLSVCLQAHALTQLLHVVDVIHPLTVNDLQQNHTLQLTDGFRFGELGFFCFVQLHSFFL